MSQHYVLKATLGPPNKAIQFLYSESPIQRDYLVKVRNIESARKLMKVSYQLVEDPHGNIDPSKMPLTPREAANFLGVAQSTIYKYITNWEQDREGPKLEARKDDDGWRISRAAAEVLKSQLGG